MEVRGEMEVIRKNGWNAEFQQTSSRNAIRNYAFHPARLMTAFQNLGIFVVDGKTRKF